jgi:hypothetical protein
LPDITILEATDIRLSLLYDNFGIKLSNMVHLFKDELYILAAMIANTSLAVKPGGRYKKYGEIFNAYIDSAKTLNSDNPRIYYLQGNSIFYTSKLFGGGAKKALPYYEKAVLLYQNEKAGNILSPYWGRKQNEGMLKKCKE